MNVSSENSARAVIQRLRPSAKKHGLKRQIIEAFLHEHLPPGFQAASWAKMKSAPDYAEVRSEAEYRAPRFIPDLSEVYPEDREIVAFEIEDRCPVSRSKLKVIYSWHARLDGWGRWDLVLITTNGRGLGWEVLIDTIAAGRESALASLRRDKASWTRTHPHLNTEEAIRESYAWRNWRMPTSEEFEAVKRTMSFV